MKVMQLSIVVITMEQQVTFGPFDDAGPALSTDGRVLSCTRDDRLPAELMAPRRAPLVEGVFRGRAPSTRQVAIKKMRAPDRISLVKCFRLE